MFMEAITCLALNIYFEARNQPIAGQVAVSQVVMNRVESSYFPDTVCEVVFQVPTRPSWKNPEIEIPVRDRCQFSWFCDGKSDTPKDKEAWDKAQFIAYGVYWDLVDDQVENALWYHAYYVTPDWASQKQEIRIIGDHIFYGWKRNY